VGFNRPRLGADLTSIAKADAARKSQPPWIMRSRVVDGKWITEKYEDVSSWVTTFSFPSLRSRLTLTSPRETARKSTARSGQTNRSISKDRLERLKSYNLLSVSDLGNLRAVEPLVDGLLFRNTLAQLSGPPGSYRSLSQLAYRALSRRAVRLG
jgi:hypothetical protein